MRTSRNLTNTGDNDDFLLDPGNNGALVISPDDDQYGNKDDVIVASIPDKVLPFTGGMPPLGLAALGLACAVVGASVLQAATRRRR